MNTLLVLSCPCSPQDFLRIIRVGIAGGRAAWWYGGEEAACLGSACWTRRVTANTNTSCKLHPAQLPHRRHHGWLWHPAGHVAVGTRPPRPVAPAVPIPARPQQPHCLHPGSGTGVAPCLVPSRIPAGTYSPALPPWADFSPKRHRFWFFGHIIVSLNFPLNVAHSKTGDVYLVSDGVWQRSPGPGSGFRFNTRVRHIRATSA